MRKLKRIIAGVGMATVLSMSLCMNAFASGASPQKNSVVSKVTEVKDKNGNSVAVVVKDIPEEHKAAVEQVQKPETLKTVVKDIIKELKEAIQNQLEDIKEELKEEVKELEEIPEENLELIDVREVEIEGDPSKVEFPLEITFEVPGVLETSKVAVLHYVDNAWQLEASKPGKGTITATFDSLSPVAFIVDKTTTASSTTAPKTGVNEMVPVIAIAVAAATCVFLIRKKKSSIS